MWNPGESRAARLWFGVRQVDHRAGANHGVSYVMEMATEATLGAPPQCW